MNRTIPAIHRTLGLKHEQIYEKHLRRAMMMANATRKKIVECECYFCAKFKKQHSWSAKRTKQSTVIPAPASPTSIYLASKLAMLNTSTVTNSYLSGTTSTSITYNNGVWDDTCWENDAYWKQVDYYEDQMRKFHLLFGKALVPHPISGEKPYERSLPALCRSQDFILPDKAILRVDHAGNYTIHDEFAQVVYQANRNRDFNPFINASDQIARFIQYVGSLRLRLKGTQIANLPLGLFVNWLIIEAAERDHDKLPPDIVPVQENKLLRAVAVPRCRWDRRFIRRDGLFDYCNAQCATKHFQRISGERENGRIGKAQSPRRIGQPTVPNIGPTSQLLPGEGASAGLGPGHSCASGVA